MKILLVEDETALAEPMLAALLKEGYRCEWAPTYALAEEKIHLYQYDCMLVDLMLPGGNGLALIGQLKAKQVSTGIIIISAKNALDDKIEGLNLGADDYLTKPFHFSELNARLKSVLRRRLFEGNNCIVYGDLQIDADGGQVSVQDKTVGLTKTEYDLLLYFVANAGRVLPKSALAEHLWGDDMDQADSYDVLYSHVKNLRKKLTEGGCPDYIRTLYGIGYKFAQP